MTPRRLLRVLPAAFLIFALPGSLPLEGASAGWVRGTVQDSAGQRLEGAEVRVDRLSGAPGILTAITNSSGEFLLSGLAPGLYILTARKDGYRDANSKLNTLLQSSISLTLPPLLGDMRPVGSEALAPPDSSWVLRLPRRDPLREQGATLDAAAAADTPLAPAGQGPDSGLDAGSRIGGEFKQLFALGGVGDTEGSASRVDLGAAFDSQVRLSLSGEATDESLPGGSGSSDPHREDTRRAARLGARFDPAAGDTFEVSALLGEQRYALLTDSAAGEDAEEGFEQETHGYGARWERDLGQSGAMDLQFGYRSVEVAASAASAAAEDGAAAEEPFSSAANQMWQASGRYRREMSARRQMEVGVRARRLQMDTPGAVAVSVLEDQGGVPFPGADGGWALDLNGREQMALKGPLSLDYGFNYHRRAEELGAESISDAFIPEAGVTVARPNGPRWSAAISLALDRPQEYQLTTAEPDPAAGSGLLSRIGYRLGMQYPLQRLGMDLGVNAAYRPYAYSTSWAESYGGGAVQDPASRSLMLSEGNAESLEFGVSLEKRFQKLVAALGSQMGQVEGYMVTGYFDEMPVQQVSYNLVRYMVMSARGYRPDLGTLVHLDYQRYVNNPEQDFDPTNLAYLYERVHVGVEQELPFVELWNARWRALLALQTLHTGALRGADLESLREAGVRESERRLSGGIAVRF